MCASSFFFLNIDTNVKLHSLSYTECPFAQICFPKGECVLTSVGCNNIFPLICKWHHTRSFRLWNMVHVHLLRGLQKEALFDIVKRCVCFSCRNSSTCEIWSSTVMNGGYLAQSALKWQLVFAAVGSFGTLGAFRRHFHHTISKNSLVARDEFSVCVYG